jgi:NADH-quinone oxidoreductase subunit N
LYFPDIYLGFAIALLLLYISNRQGAWRSFSYTMTAGWSVLPVVYVSATILYLLQAFFLINEYTTTMFGYFAATPWSPIIKLIILYYGACVTWFANKPRAALAIEFPVLILFCSFFLGLLATSTHLMSTFFALAGASLVLYVLIISEAIYHKTQDVVVRYFTQSSFSTLLALYGLLGFYMIAHSGQYGQLAIIFSVHADQKNVAALLGLITILVVVGFLFKLSAFPGHAWAPDTYEGLPTAVLAMFIVSVKVAVLLAFTRLLTSALSDFSTYWLPALSLSIVGSLVVGTLAAVKEKQINRFLAFSSINQIGYILMGLCCDSLGGQTATLLYLTIYAITTGILLITLLSTTLPKEDRGLTFLTDFRSLGAKDFRLSLLLATLFLSMAGIPPLPGFFAKFFVLWQTYESGLYGLTIAGLLCSIVSAFYYLRVVKILLFEERELVQEVQISPKLYSPALILVEIGMWGFILYSELLLSVLRELALSIFSV